MRKANKANKANEHHQVSVRLNTRDQEAIARIKDALARESSWRDEATTVEAIRYAIRKVADEL